MATPNPKSEAYAAPLMSTVQRGIFDELRTVCETAVINGASQADLRAAADVLQEHMQCAFEAAANEEATDILGIRFGDDDDGDDGEDTDNTWPNHRD